MDNKGRDPDRVQNILALTEMAKAQLKTVEVREKEIEVKSQEIAANKEVALASIAAQKETQLSWQKGYFERENSQRGFIFLMIIAGLIALAATAYFGGKDFILTIIQYVVPPLTTAFGGYYYGKKKGSE